MRIAVCDDDECEIDHLSELITEYQISRGVSLPLNYSNLIRKHHFERDCYWQYDGNRREYRKDIVDNMIKAAFCDDDLLEIDEINALFDRYCVAHDKKIAGAVFHSPLELLAEIEKGVHFDILFLDVIMPGQNGINVAREIRQYDRTTKIIFLTSSSEFAVESYTVGAFFYYVKPIKAEVFRQLMDAAISECEKEKQGSLILRCKSGITRIDLEKLVYCEVMGHNLVFHLDDGIKFESTGSMDELSSELEKYGCFLRPHRSFLINMEYIKSISYKAITLNNLEKIPIPHGKCSEIKNLYFNYAFNSKRAFIL